MTPRLVRQRRYRQSERRTCPARGHDAASARELVGASSTGCLHLDEPVGRQAQDAASEGSAARFDADTLLRNDLIIIDEVGFACWPLPAPG